MHRYPLPQELFFCNRFEYSLILTSRKHKVTGPLQKTIPHPARLWQAIGSPPNRHISLGTPLIYFSRF